MTIFLSQILGKPVFDPQGRERGTCLDILVLDRGQGSPPVRALLMRNPEGASVPVSFEDVAWLAPAIILRVAEPAPYRLRGDEVHLKDQVLDRQIVDLEGRRLVRVNDLQLARVGNEGRYCLAGVAVGVPSMLRRLGVEAATRTVLGRLGRSPRELVIPWKDVAPVQADAPIRLRVTRDKIARMDPVDLAEIVTDLDHQSGLALLQSLDTETIADTIQEIEPDLQASVLAAMPPEQAADVLEEMDPDDAADLLGSLEQEEQTTYLGLMEADESTEVAK
ncbi:MAG: hypothetical protein V1772_07190, partial [Chloroflexota bacterium]